MIVLFIFFLLVSFFLALKKPTYFVIFYLLASTKFLGFFDIEYYFVIGGVGLGMPMLNITTFVASFFITNWTKIPKKYLKFIGFFLLFILYGIIYPVTLEYETIIQAIMASKEFWTVSILFYLVTHRKKIDLKLLIKGIQYIGIYLAFVYIFYLIFKIAPPSYIGENSMGENNVRGYFPTYMSLALFLFYIELQTNQIRLNKFMIIGLILLAGLILARHFSLVFGTIFSLLVLYVFYNKNRFSLGKSLLKTFSIFGIFFILLITSSNVRNSIVNKYEMIVKGTDVALTSRDIYNQFRWQAISERPLGGYGFIHKSSPVTIKFRNIEDNKFAESLGVIDSGYVDLLVKFGYVGMSFYLFLWAKIIFPVLFRPKKYYVVQLVMAAYLMQYFLINYTWSVFSFSHGLIPAFIAVFLLLFQSTKYAKKCCYSDKTVGGVK